MMKSWRKRWHILLTSLQISIRNLPRTRSMQVAQASFTCGQSSFLCFYQYSLMLFIQSRSSLPISLILRSAQRSFWLKGKNLVRYFFSKSMLLASSHFSVSEASSSLPSQEFSSLPLDTPLVKSALPLCFVFMWVQRAGQLKQDLPHPHEKLRPSSSFLVRRLRLSSTMSSDMSLSFFEAWLDQLMPREAIPNKIQNGYQSASYNSNRTVMLAFLGLKVLKAATNKHRYREALQEIRHYLSFKNKIQVEETEYVVTLRQHSFEMHLVKNQHYLHSNYYNLPLFANEDWELLDICYESLMVLREAFPSALKIQLITDSQSKLVTDFIAKKEEEFNRRVNSNLKVIAERSDNLDCEQIQQLVYLTAQHYTRKNKTLAMKTLLLKVDQANVSNITESSLQKLSSLQQPEHKRIVAELTKKIKTLQFDLSKNKENRIKNANPTQKEQPVQPLKANALVFQLKETYSMQRICNLLSAAINQHDNSELLAKMEKTVTLLTNRFVDNYYQQASLFSNQFGDCVKAYWYKRGKAMNETALKALQRKDKETRSRPKLQSSRKF